MYGKKDDTYLLWMIFLSIFLSIRHPQPPLQRRVLLTTIDHGFENQVKADYASVACWYQNEPHSPYPPVPGIDQRQPSSLLVKVMQTALVAGVPALLGLVFLRCLRLSRK